MNTHATRHGVIHTSHDTPPVPDRRFDWSAIHEDYDGASHFAATGYGKTEAEAIADLLDLLDND
jgi:hypothetical protein